MAQSAGIPFRKIIGSDPLKPVTTTVNGAREEFDVNISPRPGDFRSAFVVDSSGSNELNINGSTPVEFNVVPNTGKIYVVQTLVLTIIDTGIKFNKFGGIAALSNGVKIEFQEGGNSIIGLAESPFVRNSQFYEGGLSPEIQTEETDIFIAMFNFAVQAGTTLELADARSDFVRVTVQDNLTSLSNFKMIVHGYEVDE